MSEKKVLRLDDLEIYQLSMEIGEFVWAIVDKWNYFQKKTVGEQFTRSADSIAANISEGYGRYFLKKKENFHIIVEVPCLKQRPGLKNP